MKHLQIIYDWNKCISAAFGEAIDPEHFLVKEDKAELIGGITGKKGIFTLDLTDIDGAQKSKVIEAATSCPVNAIAVKDLSINEVLVSMDIKASNSREITASYNEPKEWKMDPKGYFLIRIDENKHVIEAGHCIERNIVDAKITGKNATEVFNTIIREGLISSFQHASYLGKELYKAELALKNKLKYVQDEDLKSS